MVYTWTLTQGVQPNFCWSLVPQTIKSIAYSIALGVRDLKRWVLGPSGFASFRADRFLQKSERSTSSMHTWRLVGLSTCNQALHAFTQRLQCSSFLVIAFFFLIYCPKKEPHWSPWVRPLRRTVSRVSSPVLNRIGILQVG